MDPNGPAEPALVPLDRPPGRTQWAFSHAGRSYAVFEVAGTLIVTDGACPHNGGPLGEGLVRDGVVTCPWHWYSYELATGHCRTAAGYELLDFVSREPSLEEIFIHHYDGRHPGDVLV